MNTTLRSMAAVGAGRMGRGIALAFAWAGHEISVIDLKRRSAAASQALLTEAAAEIRASLQALAELDALPVSRIEEVAHRVHFVAETEADAAIAKADLIFEGVTETLEAKREAFARLGSVARHDAILASTTSTILVTDLVPMVAHPQRLINAHWLNPAYLIPLVELSAHPLTDRNVVRSLQALLEEIGKVPVVCAPAPGYIVPRLQALIMNEAARLVEEGIATPEEIDKATRYGLGFRFAALGVLEFIDYGGNDILYHASRYLSDRLSRERYNAPAIIGHMMAEGRNGLRSGAGFFRYEGRDEKSYRKDVLARTLGMLRHAGLYRPPR